MRFRGVVPGVLAAAVVVVAVVLAVAVALVAAAPSLAAGAGLTVTGPTTVKSGQRATVTVFGTVSEGEWFAAYGAPGACAGRLEDQLSHRHNRLLLRRWMTRSFTLRLLLPRARHGKHHVCAYLYYRRYDNLITDARASFRYVAS